MSRHRREAVRTGAAQQLQQQRLRLVVGVVRERDEVGVGAARAPRSAPCVPSPRGSRRPRARRARDARRAARRASRIGPRRTPPSASACGGEPVMDVHRGERETELGRDARRAHRAAPSNRGRRTARRRRASARRARRAPRDRVEQRVRGRRAAPARRRRIRHSDRRRGAARRAPATAGRPAASAGGDLLELAIRQDLVLARLEQRVERLLLQRAQRFGQRLLERHHHRGGVAMGAARRLVDDLVDQAELLQARRRDAERFGGFGRLSADFHRIDAQPSGEITE